MPWISIDVSGHIKANSLFCLHSAQEALFLVWASCACLSCTTLECCNSQLSWPTADRVVATIASFNLDLSRFNLNLTLYCIICSIVPCPANKSFLVHCLVKFQVMVFINKNWNFLSYSQSHLFPKFLPFLNLLQCEYNMKILSIMSDQPSNKKKAIHLIICPLQ